MKKRLLYAMPRMPLAKLKGDFKIENTIGEPVSRVKTIAKRIQEARMGKNQTDLDFDAVPPKDASVPALQAKVKQPEVMIKTMRRERGRKELVRRSTLSTETNKRMMGVKNFGLGKREVMSLKDIEKRLRKVHDMKNLKFILIEGDSSDLSESSTSTVDADFKCIETSESDSDMPCDPWHEAQRDCFEMDTVPVARVEVHADVHQELDSDHELEGAIGGLGEDVAALTQKSRGLHTEQNSDIASISSVENYGSGIRNSLFAGSDGAYWIKMVEGKKFIPCDERTDTIAVQWGEDQESQGSSDGEWEQDCAGMPLLQLPTKPRK